MLHGLIYLYLHLSLFFCLPAQPLWSSGTSECDHHHLIQFFWYIIQTQILSPSLWHMKLIPEQYELNKLTSCTSKVHFFFPLENMLHKTG